MELTTSELGARVGISPASASEHASVLRASGLIASHRDGRPWSTRGPRWARPCGEVSRTEPVQSRHISIGLSFVTLVRRFQRLGSRACLTWSSRAGCDRPLAYYGSGCAWRATGHRRDGAAGHQPLSQQLRAPKLAFWGVICLQRTPRGVAGGLVLCWVRQPNAALPLLVSRFT